MPIVSSTVVGDAPQIDGRRAITERHVDHLGVVYTFHWYAAPGADATAQLAGHATQLLNDLANAEIAANLQRAYNQQTAVLNYSTAAQNLAYIRSIFATLTSWDAIRLGKYISGLGLTDQQYQNVFGVGAGAQLTNLKTRIANLAAHYDTATADQGQ